MNLHSRPKRQPPVGMAKVIGQRLRYRMNGNCMMVTTRKLLIAYGIAGFFCRGITAIFLHFILYIIFKKEVACLLYRQAAYCNDKKEKNINKRFYQHISAQS